MKRPGKGKPGSGRAFHSLEDGRQTLPGRLNFVQIMDALQASGFSAGEIRASAACLILFYQCGRGYRREYFPDPNSSFTPVSSCRAFSFSAF